MHRGSVKLVALGPGGEDNGWNGMDREGVWGWFTCSLDCALNSVSPCRVKNTLVGAAADGSSSCVFASLAGGTDITLGLASSQRSSPARRLARGARM